MAASVLQVAVGDDLFRIAARLYGDAGGWTLIARANGLFDPLIQVDATLTIPPYNEGRANDGVLASE